MIKGNKDKITELFKKVKLNKTKPLEIEELIKDGIDINVLNGWGETLIYNCAKHAVNLELMEWLYQKGCDPNIINKKNLNAYDGCMRWNKKKNVSTVLTWLANKNIKFTKEYKDMPEIHNI